MKDFDIVDVHGSLVCALRFTDAYASVYVPVLGDIILGYVTESHEMTGDELRALIGAPESPETEVEND